MKSITVVICYLIYELHVTAMVNNLLRSSLFKVKWNKINQVLTVVCLQLLKDYEI